MTMGTGGIFGNPFKRPMPEAFPNGVDTAPAEAKSGGGFFSEGGAGRSIAGYIGDALMQMSGMRPIFGPQQQYNRALQDKLRMAQIERQQGMQDWQAKERWKVENTPDWGYEQDNAGNLHRYNKRTGEFDKSPVFIDPNPKMFMQGDQLVRVPNTYASAPTAPVGKLTPIDDGAPTSGGLSANQAGDSLGAAYRSKSITSQEAAAIRKSLGPNGQAAFEQWMRDNNIVIGDR